jgi:VWFA-related protein
MRALILILPLLLQVPVLSPPPVTPPPPSEMAMTVDVDLVNILFTVSDRKGRLITSLPREKFRVFDNNQRQEITHFSSETELPLNLALLIDTSGSVQDKIDFEREAAITFLESAMRPGTDRALVVTFDLRLTLLQDYTDDVAALDRATQKIRVGGGTPLYDAIFLTATQKLAHQSGRRIAIVISDGVDTTSRKSLEEALKAARLAEATIYCISTNSIQESYPDSDLGNQILKKLAEQTGGRAYFPSKSKDLATVFRKLNEELRGQYTLAYSPREIQRDGTFHKIRIETDDRQLRIHARDGYFAGR